MIALVVLLLLAAVLIGGPRLGAGFRGVAKLWRPTTGLLSVVAMMAAAVLAVREDWWIALGMAALAAGLALGARKRLALKGGAPNAKAQGAGVMSAAEARSLLGVPENATPETVDAAYRRLIRFAHPDQGGTAGLAAQLNSARTTLRTR